MAPEAQMRLILSRKGFDSRSGGCPSPILPDGSMIALPIPDRSSPVTYQDLTWRGHNLGDVVSHLTRAEIRSHFGAHLDPDLRPGICRRAEGWRPALGQCAAAQGHLRNQGVREGDLFLFWGLFREVDADLRWLGPRKHVIWGWLQVGAIAPVDAMVRPHLATSTWSWAARHPHLAFVTDASNTLYLACDYLRLPGSACVRGVGSGVFDSFHSSRQLTANGARSPSSWSLPGWFLPEGRPPLSYHDAPERWHRNGGRAALQAASRGQEFVLDLDAYPEAADWIAELIRTRGGVEQVASA